MNLKSKQTLTVTNSEMANLYKIDVSAVLGVCFEDLEKLGISVKSNQSGETNQIYLLAEARPDKQDREVQHPKGEKTDGNGDVDDLASMLAIQTNGIIVEKDPESSRFNRVVCMSQNKMKELESFEDIVSLSVKFPESNLEYTEDGTVIRLYNYKGVWRTATTRCINAECSYWTSEKSFADMFWEIFNTSLLSDLDTNCTYIFVLLHTDNRIVVKHLENTLVFISKIDNNTFVEDTNNPFIDVYGIRSTKKITLRDSQNFEMLYYPVKRGVLLKTVLPNGTAMCYKLDFQKYTDLKRVRGNVPHIKYRYLELLSDTESLLQLIDNYKENFFIFAVINHSLNKVINNIFKLYRDSHIKHTVKVDESHMYHRTLKQLHATYKNTGKKVTIDDVQSRVYSLDKSVLKKFLGWV